MFTHPHLVGAAALWRRPRRVAAMIGPDLRQYFSLSYKLPARVHSLMPAYHRCATA